MHKQIVCAYRQVYICRPYIYICVCVCVCVCVPVCVCVCVCVCHVMIGFNFERVLSKIGSLSRRVAFCSPRLANVKEHDFSFLGATYTGKDGDMVIF